jgi:hypothetical protein
MQRGDVIEVRFNPEKTSRGLFEEPEPKLEACAPVILVLGSDFLVGRWEEDCFVHPANQEELAGLAEEAVRAVFPCESFDSKTLRIFTCPMDVASKFDWNWSKE